jgi:hypothetical protein
LPSRRRDGARVFEDAEANPPGAYCVDDKLPVVFIARRRRGAERLRVKIRESAHRWPHFPNVRVFHQPGQ